MLNYTKSAWNPYNVLTETDKMIDVVSNLSVLYLID